MDPKLTGGQGGAGAGAGRTRTPPVDAFADRRREPRARRTRYRVCVIGGGTGSYQVLRGLREHEELWVQSIVNMMDSGGDSGRLRDEFGVLPPGDVRRCLIALAEEGAFLRELFSYRFTEAPLEGRSFGNLFFLAATRALGSEEDAIDALGRLLQIRGRVLAVTWDHVHLVAELADGTVIEGEANIDVPKHDASVPIARVHLEPRARANPTAVAAIAESDVIVLAPGDLYTSTIPNLLVEGIPEALRATSAPLVCVLNLMTKYGNDHGYAASRHVAEIARYAGRVPDLVLAHAGPIPAAQLERYEAQSAYRVQVDADGVAALGVRELRERDLMSVQSLVRHDPARTAAALVEAFADLLRGRGRYGGGRLRNPRSAKAAPAAHVERLRTDR